MNNPYNRIVLIGNGFDKALGLKTSYADFILNYLKEKILEAIKNVGYDSELITIKLRASQSYLLNDKYIKSINNTSSVMELLNFTDKQLSITYKDEFLEEIVKNYSEARWVDIEQYYYKKLSTMFNSFKVAKYETEIPEEVFELNKCMDALSEQLSEYIRKQQDSNSINYIESPLCSLFEDFQEPLRPDRSKLLFEEKRRKTPPANVMFLNFNYTDTILRFLKNLNWTKTSPRHIHIHGRVNDGTNPIIFGYGDDTGDIYKQLELEGENEWLRIIKSFKYPRTNNYHTLLNFLEVGDFDIIIVGHSCGLSDKTLLKTIFEHKHCLFIQNYYYRNEKEDFNKRIQISRHFSDKPLMRERLLTFDEHAKIPQQPYKD